MSAFSLAGILPGLNLYRSCSFMSAVTVPVNSHVYQLCCVWKTCFFAVDTCYERDNQLSPMNDTGYIGHS